MREFVPKGEGGDSLDPIEEVINRADKNNYIVVRELLPRLIAQHFLSVFKNIKLSTVLSSGNYLPKNEPNTNFRVEK